MKFSRNKIREMSKRYGGLRAVARLAGVDYENLREYVLPIPGRAYANGRQMFYEETLLTETVTALRGLYRIYESGLTLGDPP